MGRPTKKEYRYKNVGRKTKLTPELVSKLEECAQLRATVSESCFYAGISRDSYYKWMKKYPELSDRLEELREKPFLKARQTIVNGLADTAVAFKFLEKEKPEDYAERLKIETDEGGVNASTPDEDRDAIAAMHLVLKANREKRSLERAKKDGEIKE